MLDVDPQDGSNLPEAGRFTLTTTAGRVDLWTHPEDLKGCPSWPALTGLAEKFIVRGIPITVVGKDDLLAMKRAAGRDKDKADIAALTSRQPDRSRQVGDGGDEPRSAGCWRTVSRQGSAGRAPG